ncbi:aminodeoxychorismate/anthranilate synthase component II [Halorussus gelatinilyticus]|uniref:anthranilate synthase n=1 Tax=Halorussus gelatinilyticus TaxID=2937524 RepID=A0A8U0IG17_9EURY|nr:aminodeoxychorismate/anthranilate synthase component II [Halorussus gelatinilyticus]UPW00030.1 aminodeoxychorismate/anthranilate synthase component II [Halorussus gelatinilyticus]
MSILVIDNYDSFVHNLVQYVGEFDPEVTVRRNDAVTLPEVRDLDPDGIVVSPGPGTPADAGVSIPLFEETDYPILGVCLGHQALCAAEGATVGHAPEVVHGKPSPVTHDGAGVFAGLPDPFEVGRYHSLAVERAEIPDTLDVAARTVDTESAEEGGGGEEASVVMAVRHRERPHVGVQFHPESILTDAGKRLVENFCASCRS